MKRAIVIFGVVMLAVSAAGAQADGLYFTNDWYDKIQRSDLDGGNVTNLVTSGLGSPRGLALDTNAGKMYWADWSADRIGRANLNGSNIEYILTGLHEPLHVALDPLNHMMYWTENDRGIFRATMDGANVEQIRGGDPKGVALDVANGKVYYTGSSSVSRANLDGTGAEALYISTGSSHINTVALNLFAGKMYWSDNGEEVIQRASLDGSNVETVVDSARSPHAVAIDVANGKLYWSEYFDGTIQRSDLSGDNIETIIDTDLRDVWAIVPVPEPATLGLLALGGLTLLRRRK